MKVINKLFCFFSVLVLCLSFLCFNVSAQSASLVESDIVCNYSKLSSMESKYKSSPYVRVADLYNHKVNNGEDIPFHFFDTSDPLGCLNAFTNSFGAYYSGFTSFDVTFDIEKNSDFYYVLYHGTSVQGSYGSGYGSVFIASSSPFHLVDGKYVSDSGDNIYILFLNYQSCSNDVYNFDSYNLSKYTFKYDSEHNTALKPYFSFQNHGTAYTTFVYTFSSVYSNIVDLSFPDGYEISKVPGTESLSEQIEVKLTPEFCLDMDRIDPLTNQSDYFKLEITNNSDSAIQWCSGIYDPELVTADTMDILSLSSWAYVCRTTYYDFTAKEDKGIFRTTYTYSGTLKTGSFDYHYLEPGETFSDVIFWENININPNVIYHFFVNAVKTDLKYATLNINPPVTEESSDMHSVTIIEDTYYNTILEGASDFKKLDCNIFNIEFSCLSMPAFTTTVRGGNSILNTSGNDRYKLYGNYETVSNIDGQDTKINKNYTDPSILANTFNRSDVNVDIDSFSVDDVKSYITSCQSFFILIKEALLSFPAFIWALICFGLTGLIVIAVVKALL